MELELYNPKVAFRSCEFCKQFVHDEETGEPRRNIRTKELLPRLKLDSLPCVMDVCAKGHYLNPIKISRRERKIIDLYKASKASGGAVLNDAERNDRLILKAFAVLEDVFETAKNEAMAQSVAAIALASGTKQ